MIETLRDAWQANLKITMRCAQGKGDGMKRIRECTYSADLDLTTLVCTRGPNFPVADLSGRLMCPRCGSRRVRLLIGMPSNPAAMPRAAGNR
jgi:hypothetical protein